MGLSSRSCCWTESRRDIRLNTINHSWEGVRVFCGAWMRSNAATANARSRGRVAAELRSLPLCAHVQQTFCPSRAGTNRHGSLVPHSWCTRQRRLADMSCPEQMTLFEGMMLQQAIKSRSCRGLHTVWVALHRGIMPTFSFAVDPADKK